MVLAARGGAVASGAGAGGDDAAMGDYYSGAAFDALLVVGLIGDK